MPLSGSITKYKEISDAKDGRTKRERSGTYPTRMPSSISVGDTLSPNPTTNYIPK
jgi:hypothetical protein